MRLRHLTERDFPLSGSLRRQLSPRRAFLLVRTSKNVTYLS